MCFDVCLVCVCTCVRSCAYACVRVCVCVCVCVCSEQIEYPKNIHLIRGNHEASDINALFGFRIECIERMVSSAAEMP